VVNTVTKSGTNSIMAKRITTAAITPLAPPRVHHHPDPDLAGVFTPLNFKPTDLRDRWGFGIGGPFMKTNCSGSWPTMASITTSLNRRGQQPDQLLCHANDRLNDYHHAGDR